MSAADPLAHALASAMLAGVWTEAAMARRARSAVYASSRQPERQKPRPQSLQWVLPLVRDALQSWPAPPRDQPRAFAGWVAAHPSLRGRRRVGGTLTFTPAPLRMSAAAPSWPVRRLDDVGDVAAWLGADAGELAWHADTQGRLRRSPERLRHYRVHAQATRSGGVRVLEAPKERLLLMQRRILRDVLEAIPAHPCAHAVRGRPALDAARRHEGRPLVVQADCEAFFATVTAARVYGVFRMAGYAEAVAHVLTGLCTTRLAADTWRRIPVPLEAGPLEAHWRLGRRLAAAHLPQGAPTSPLIATLAAWRLDARLDGLARSFGVTYTRYVDDLVFSGRSFTGKASAEALLAQVREIVAAEGFSLNHAKTRTASQAQRQAVLGLVVNRAAAIPRREYDELRAVLHNCARHGPAGQNRDAHPDFRAHLLGRVSWVAHVQPARGARLRAAFDAIDWS